MVELLSEADADAYLAAPSALAFWRKKRGLTQEALAASVGISQPYLGQIERGRRTPDVRFYVKVARLLGVRVEDIAPE